MLFSRRTNIVSTKVYTSKFEGIAEVPVVCGCFQVARNEISLYRLAK